MSVLSEDLALERAQLEIKAELGSLTDADRWRRKTLANATLPPIGSLSLGARCATSLEFKRLAVKAASTSERVALDDDYPLAHITTGAETKALITATSDTSGGAFITNHRDAYAPIPKRRLRILDLVNVRETTVDAVDYARQTAFTNAAAAVAEATSVTTGTKPEATIAFEKVVANVVDYESWAPVTRRALADASEMRAVVDEQLIFAARRVLEEAIVTAMIAAAGSTQAKGADALPVATLKLLTAMRNAEVEPTAALLNPTDYEQLRSVTTAYSSPPITVDSNGTERLFSVPLVVTASVPDDTALLADMSAVTVWLRSMEVFLSISHASYFVQNLAAILGSVRAALGVTQTAGVGTVTGWD